MSKQIGHALRSITPQRNRVNSAANSAANQPPVLTTLLYNATLRQEARNHTGAHSSQPAIARTEH